MWEKIVALLIGSVLGWLKDSLFPSIKKAVTGWWAKLTRGWAQKKAQDKYEEDIRSGKPKDEDAKKREEDWINS